MRTLSVFAVSGILFLSISSFAGALLCGDSIVLMPNVGGFSVYGPSYQGTLGSKTIDSYGNVNMSGSAKGNFDGSFDLQFQSKPSLVDGSDSEGVASINGIRLVCYAVLRNR